MAPLAFDGINGRGGSKKRPPLSRQGVQKSGLTVAMGTGSCVGEVSMPVPQATATRGSVAHSTGASFPRMGSYP